MRSLRHRLAHDEGFTLIEVWVVVTLIAIAGAFFYTFLFSVQRSVNTQQQRSDNNTQARLAVERLDREIRSGNVLYDPLAEFDPNYSLRVYTQSNQTPLCVQWRIHDGRLQRRDWPPNDPPVSLEWELVVDGIVNKDPEFAVPAFILDPEQSKSGRTVIVEILAGEPGSDEVARIKASITGRNTTFNYPVVACESPPPP